MDEEITAEIDSVSVSGRSMLYPVHRVKMLYYSCGAYVVDLSNFNLLTTEGNFLPHIIIVVLVREDAMHGNYERSFQLSTFQSGRIFSQSWFRASSTSQIKV